MGVSLEVYRCRVGLFRSSHAVKSVNPANSHGLSLSMHCLPVAALCFLLLIAGIESNPGPTQYKCKQCLVSFPSASKYCKHISIHKSWKNFSIPCCFPNCSRQLQTVKSFQNHASKFHQERRAVIVPLKCVQCPLTECQNKLESRKTYMSHMVDHLRKGESFVCSLQNCRKQFSVVSKFRVHTSRFHPAETTNFFDAASEIASNHEETPPIPEETLEYPENFDDFGQGSEDDILAADDDDMDEDPYPQHVIKDELARFYLRLEGENLLPTSTVQIISEEVKLISELSHHCLKRSLKEKLKEIGLEDQVIKSVVKSTFRSDPVFNIHHKGEDVEQLSTHHLRVRYWQKRFPYVEPKQISWGSIEGGQKKKVSHYISIRESLTILLKDEKIKKMVKESFINPSTPQQPNGSEILKDFTDGSAYVQHMTQHHNGKCLQLLLFQDAFEFNAFGPSSGNYKPIGFYYNLGNLPPEYRSKVDLIQLVYLLLEKHLKPTQQEELDEKDLLKEALKPLLDELVDLKVNGIEIDGEKVPVCLMFLIGDSLGQHQVGSFIKSFIGEFFCRFCNITRAEFLKFPFKLGKQRKPNEYDSCVTEAKRLWIAKRSACLRAAKKRAIKNRAERVAAKSSAPGTRNLMRLAISKSGFKKLLSINYKGIKYRPSPFISNETNFHVCSPAMPPCLAHDLMEGVVKCTLAKILKYFIETKNWFDLVTLNRRIKSFKPLGSDALDAPAPLKKLDELSGNACQIWTLLRVLPFIIGDLIKDHQDEMWQLYLSLKEIVEYVCAPKISMKQVAYLKLIIGCYLGKLKKLEEYLPSCLIPKQHFLCHYPDLIAIFGPLIRLFTLRYESKHMFFKRVVRASKSYINITQTMAKKYMCRFAFDHSSDLVPPDVIYSPNKTLLVDFKTLSPLKLQAIQLIDLKNVEVLQSVSIKGINYKIGYYLVLDAGEDPLDLKVGFIDMILLTGANEVKFLLEEKNASNTGNGYYSICEPSMKTYICKSVDDTQDYYALPSYRFQQQECITLKHSVLSMDQF